MRRNTAALLAALAIASPGSALADEFLSAQTPRSTWSTSGYQQLRFGMGPGDVALAIKEPGALSPTTVLERWGDSGTDALLAHLRNHGVTLGERPVRLVAFFRPYRLGLWSVMVCADFPKDEPARLRATWLRRIRSLLVEKYGAPDAGGPDPRWTRGDLDIFLGPWQPDGSEACISYSSVATLQEIRRNGRQQSTDAADQDKRSL